MSAAKKPVTIKVYQLKISLRAISPLIWRRLRVTSDTTSGPANCLTRDGLWRTSGG